MGRLSNVLPDALSFAFEALTQKGIMKGAELEIKYLPAGFAAIPAAMNTWRMNCRSCPACKSRSFVITGGEERILESIDCVEKL